MTGNPSTKQFHCFPCGLHQWLCKWIRLVQGNILHETMVLIPFDHIWPSKSRVSNSRISGVSWSQSEPLSHLGGGGRRIHELILNYNGFLEQVDEHTQCAQSWKSLWFGSRKTGRYWIPRKCDGILKILWESLGLYNLVGGLEHLDYFSI